MKAIGARLALWYASISTATLVGLFIAGFFLLAGYLHHGLDRTNRVEFERIKSSLGPDYGALSAPELEKRFATSTEIAGTPSYVEVVGPDQRRIASSRSLASGRLPESTGSAGSTIIAPVLGKIRLQRFAIGAYTLVIAVSSAEIDEVMDGYTVTCLILVSGMLVLSVITGLLMSRAAMRPVRLIQETANRIRSDNLSERINVSEVQDEISNLARLLNEMFDRLEVSFIQIRKFTAEASHELKTPLTLVRLQAERLLIDGGLSAHQEEALQVQLEEISRLHKIIEDLLFLSRAEARAIRLELARNDPGEFIRGFAADARLLAEHSGVGLRVTIEGQGSAEFDAKWLRQVLFNLVQNALNVSPAKSSILLSSDLTIETWRVAVEDEGPGVPESQRERIFERFVRLDPGAKRPTRGSGLGLTISRSILGLHRGTIRAEAARQGTGLRVVFEIPITEINDRPLTGTSPQGTLNS